ncbi:C-C motif chemokine 19-like [Emydura macquarii macquarii]|uniref:C-C motif chemokine 19-like n=1 Tax=Emydura macquarii macquarii TaxID=1129001 RepID=UPI003529F9F8
MELARSMAFLSLVVLSLWSILPVSSTNDALDCCLRTSPMHIPRKIVQDYEVQLIQDGCPIHAVVFITVRGKRLCAPPYAHWVQRLIAKVDNMYKSKVNLWRK